MFRVAWPGAVLRSLLLQDNHSNLCVAGSCHGDLHVGKEGKKEGRTEKRKEEEGMATAYR